MRPDSRRKRQDFGIEPLEQRNAPSRGGSLAAALHSLRDHANGHGHAAHVHHVRPANHPLAGNAAAAHHNHGGQAPAGQGADDPANHDAADNRGSQPGADDPVNHDVTDNHGAQPGVDDPATHDATDDNGAQPGPDDPANHEAGDDNGSHRHRGGRQG